MVTFNVQLTSGLPLMRKRRLYTPGGVSLLTYTGQPWEAYCNVILK